MDDRARKEWPSQNRNDQPPERQRLDIDPDHDPRRLGAYDWLGVIDMRVPGSAIDVFRAHIEEVQNGKAQTMQG